MVLTLLLSIGLNNIYNFSLAERLKETEDLKLTENNMVAIIGAITFSVVIILSVLIICGLPLGELTMGGQYKVFPKKLRLVLVTQLILQIFFVIVILQMGSFFPLWFSKEVTKIICIVMSVYLSLNTVMNFVSKSKKEKCIMTPLSFVAAVCFWITALV